MAFIALIVGAGAAAFIAFSVFIAGADAAGSLAAASICCTRAPTDFVHFMAFGMVLNKKGSYL